MGLTVNSVGINCAENDLHIDRRMPEKCVVALAGNPNVGKSTVFNALTGLNQHTGNWPGKTVTNARGQFRSARRDYTLVDLPGTYSLMAHSAEEEVARDFVCFGQPDAVIIVCDATCLERNLNLVLQIHEISDRVLVCVNLVDEARKKGIAIDFGELSRRLGVPVVPTVARKKRSLRQLVDELDGVVERGAGKARCIEYPKKVEAAIARVESALKEKSLGGLPARWVSLKLIDGDASLVRALNDHVGYELADEEAIVTAVQDAHKMSGLDADGWKDAVVTGVVRASEKICDGVVTGRDSGYSRRDRQLDQVLTSRKFGYPIMLALLLVVFWLTIAGANVPSEMLSEGLFWFQDRLTEIFAWIGAPDWLHGALVLGVYRVLAWVVSVMLPPMAIFFPLFTLLEDAGYLPRVAYNLDCPFRKCCACGKQALTMCMGFGCNAAGVVGCRIIDSPRERLIAMLTNCLVPCNGRFPMLISIITMFFALSAGGLMSSLWCALMLTLAILLGIGMTFAVSKLLSKTLLRGVPSSFTLELPPFRRPQIGKVIVRSVFDRTLFVLGRAAAVAAPAGLIIWLTANVSVGGASLLRHCASFLDPLGQLLGLDGVILMAFVLGFPANEIVIPIAVMAYLAQGSLQDSLSAVEMHRLFVDNGWTWLTALNMMIFTLFHWPCSTTLMTIRKETGSAKWTIVAFILPTVIGMLLCLATATIVRVF